MQTIGIIGGIASGKSAVAGELQRLGAGLLDADRAGHAILEVPEVRSAIVARWGECVIGSNGMVDRSAVARIVFAPTPEGQAEKRFLEELTHARIRRQLEQEADEMAANGVQVAVLDAALLLEAGWDVLCDIILFVDAAPDTRLQRATARGWDIDDFNDREVAQVDLGAKRRRVDAIIDNSGSIEAMREQVERFWERWLAG